MTAVPGSSWSVIGTGDFNGDGKTDILLHNTDGSYADWTMNGSTITAGQYLTYQGVTAVPGSSWSVIGTGDFNGDGKTDILLHNTDGSYADWTMDGSTITAAEYLTYQGAIARPGSSFTFEDIGDYTGDGKADILFHNTDGSYAEWAMSGSTIMAGQSLTYQGAVVHLDNTWHTI